MKKDTRGEKSHKERVKRGTRRGDKGHKERVKRDAMKGWEGTQRNSEKGRKERMKKEWKPDRGKETDGLGKEDEHSRHKRKRASSVQLKRHPEGCGSLQLSWSSFA